MKCQSQLIRLDHQFPQLRASVTGCLAYLYELLRPDLPDARLISAPQRSTRALTSRRLASHDQLHKAAPCTTHTQSQCDRDDPPPDRNPVWISIANERLKSQRTTRA